MSLAPDDDPTTLASSGVQRMLTQVIAAARLTSGLVGAIVALVGMAAPARPGLVVAGSVLVVAWSGLFAWFTLQRDPSPDLIGIDVAVVVALLLAHPWLVPEQVRVVSAGTGWVDIIAGAGVLIAQAGLRQPAGLITGLLIAGAYAVGDRQFREAPVHLAVEAVIGAGLAVLLRRAAAAADDILTAAADQRQETIVRAAVRADERHHQRYLHDTVLATLTMVHIGGVASDSVALRERAAGDLQVIDRLRAHPASAETSRPVVRLDVVLRGAVRQPRPGQGPLDVSLDVAPVELPAEVATAMAQCVTEALTNVARHAETGQAHLAGQAEGKGASVTVTDNGPGFDVTAVPAHRRGLRESIAGRMRSIGGSADVRSGAGTGTQVVLRWPDA
jgi:signal transduction histidine kinase